MKIELLVPHNGLKAGQVWNCPWAFLARTLIALGKARAVEPCDVPRSEPTPEVQSAHTLADVQPVKAPVATPTTTPKAPKLPRKAK